MRKHEPTWANLGPSSSIFPQFWTCPNQKNQRFVSTGARFSQICVFHVDTLLGKLGEAFRDALGSLGDALGSFGDALEALGDALGKPWGPLGGPSWKTFLGRPSWKASRASRPKCAPRCPMPNYFIDHKTTSKYKPIRSKKQPQNSLSVWFLFRCHFFWFLSEVPPLNSRPDTFWIARRTNRKLARPFYQLDLFVSQIFV